MVAECTPTIQRLSPFLHELECHLSRCTFGPRMGIGHWCRRPSISRGPSCSPPGPDGLQLLHLPCLDPLLDDPKGALADTCQASNLLEVRRGNLGGERGQGRHNLAESDGLELVLCMARGTLSATLVTWLITSAPRPAALVQDTPPDQQHLYRIPPCGGPNPTHCLLRS